MSHIYLDANATSAVRPEARDAVLSVLERDGEFRNPSSVHRAGRAARKVVSDARDTVVQLLNRGASSRAQLFFTSGGTESCAAMIHGFLPEGLTHIICSAIEHPAIIQTVKRLERGGHSVSWVNADSFGVVNVDEFVSALRPETSLCILMAANNETGALQPIETLARTLRSNRYYGAIICDFTQAVWKSSLSAQTLFSAGVDAIAVSAHKIGCVKGIGAVLLNSNENLCRQFEPLLLGGPQEARFRAGTENVPAIAAFGAVAKRLLPRLETDLATIRSLREDLWRRIASIPGVQRITPSDSPTEVRSLSNTLMLGVEGCRGDDLVVSLDLLGVAASTGSACQSGKQAVSHVMTAMGRVGNDAREVVRLSLDWDATEPAIVEAADRFTRAVSQMRGATSFAGSSESLRSNESR